MINTNKRRKRRFTALLLASLMILTGALPLTAFAVEPDGSVPISRDEEAVPEENTDEIPAVVPDEPEEAEPEEAVKDTADEAGAEAEPQEETSEETPGEPAETEESEASEPELPETTEDAETEEESTEILPEALPEDLPKEPQEEAPVLEPSPFSASQADELSYSLLYFMKHGDPSLVDMTAIRLESVITPVTIARGVATYNAARQSDFDVTERNFIASMAYEIPVYDIDPESSYYVAMPDVNLYSRDFGSYDIMLTYNNNNGEAISGYAYRDSILYIPKSAVDDPDNENGFITGSPIAVQMNYYFRGGVDSDREGNADFSKRIPVQILSGKTPENRSVTVENMFDGNVTIPIGKYSEKNIQVMLNGMMLPIGTDAYDVKNGNLVIYSSAAVISSVNVVTDSRAKTIATRMLGNLIPEVYADTTVTPDQMAYFRDENGNYVTLNIDLDQLFVGWRGVYTGAKIQYSGKSTLGNTGDDGYNESRIKKLMALKGWMNSVKYLYGPYVVGNSQGGYEPQDLVGIWAINSYTLGKNKAFETSDTLTADMLVTNDVEGDGGESVKKTIYDWMRQYAAKLEKNNGQVGNTQSAGQGGNVNSNGIGGFTNFAFQFPKTVQGSQTNLVSSGNPGAGKPNLAISFASEEIDESYYLAASCSHLDDAVASDGDGAATVYVACLAIGEDYAVFSFVGADAYSQDGAAIYKFKTGSPMKLQKTSSNTGISKDNQCYADLSGAVYGLYASEADARADNERIRTFTTTANGETNEESVASGTYYVKELTAPKNYALNEAIIRISVKGQSEIQTFTVTDAPQNAFIEILLRKTDRETGAQVPLGSASFEGAEFTVKYYDSDGTRKGASGEPLRTWVFRTDAKGEVSLQDPASFVSGDELYTGSDGRYVLPVGTYMITETKAPEGYLLSDEEMVVAVTPDGTAETIGTYAAPEFPEQVKRGDLSFIKVLSDPGNEQDMTALANIPFEIISNTTGERHIIITDENGQFDSSADWFPHSEDTNANDAALDEDGTVDDSRLNPEAGVWFGTDREGNSADPDDDLGALPYDTYTLNELPCKANEGMMLIKGRTFSIRVNNRAISLGTIDDKADRKLCTEAQDELTGEHIGSSQSERIIDTVTYVGLIEGEQYTLKGVLMDRKTGEPVTAGAQEITAELGFTAEASAGEIQIEFVFEKDSLKGRAVVVFETLEHNGVTILAHEDLNDEGQTVTYPEIGTTATDKSTGTHEGGLQSTVTIQDKVSYRNLVPGREYTMTGILMDKEQADVLRDEQDESFTVTQAFTPEKADGTVTITFEVPGSVVAGKKIVCFEYCEQDDLEIAVHAELNDEEQMVSYPEGEIPKSIVPKRFIPDTGDHENLLLFSMLLFASAAALLVFRRRRSDLQKDIDEASKDM